MEKPTLDEFIQRVRDSSTRGNEWVRESRFESLYVRYGHRYIQGVGYYDVLDLANLTVEEEHQRTGVFTRLVARLRKTYPGMHLYVESVAPDFQPLLLRLGFSTMPYDSFFLEGDKT